MFFEGLVCKLLINDSIEGPLYEMKEGSKKVGAF